MINCEHYNKNCYIISPCCGMHFGCRKCHDSYYEFKDNEHKLNRFDIKRIVCKICNLEQDVSNECTSCKIKFGKYFCQKCNYFDNDLSKQQFHCDKCGICRVGGKENFFHCDDCNMCLNISTKDTHICMKDSLQNCPMCFDELFDSTKSIMKMRCGHTIHVECYNDLLKEGTFSSLRCPLCSKSSSDWTQIFRNLDNEIELTPMPEELRTDVQILCNDCSKESDTKFHIVGLKCLDCGSYNTKQI